MYYNNDINVLPDEFYASRSHVNPILSLHTHILVSHSPSTIFLKISSSSPRFAEINFCTEKSCHFGWYKPYGACFELSHVFKTAGEEEERRNS